MELWKEAIGSPGYEVSDAGRVRNTSTGRVLVQTPIPAGYLSVKPSRKTRLVHAMIAEAFHGPRPTQDHQVMHLDGTRTNNAAHNLRWGLPVENASHRVRHGTHIAGERHPAAKLTETQVAQIRRTEGKSLRELGAEFGVHLSLISLIKRNKVWRHV